MSVLCAMSVLSSCSGDDTPESAGKSASPSSGSSSGAKETVTRKCKVTVSVTGAVEASWKGKGTSMTMNSGPSALYRAEDGKNQISLYAKGEDFATSANVTVGSDTFTTPPGETGGLKANKLGKSGSVDADVVGVKPGSKAHLTASFDC